MLSTIRDAFDFAQLGDDMLKSIEAGSKQAQILTDMLKEVQDCGEFIQRYANDPELCMSLSISSGNVSLKIRRETDGQKYWR